MKNNKIKILIALLILSTGVLAAQTVYRYKCPRDFGVYSFSMPGVYKCPSDGAILAPVY